MNPATVAVNCHTPNLSRLLVGASLGEASITVCKEHWTHPEDPTSVLWFWCTNSCVCCCSVPKSYLTLCNPMDCSTPGLPVYQQLLELAQTHVCWVRDAIQPSHPLSSPSPLPSVFPRIRVFSNESVLRIRWPKYWRFSISPSMNIQDWFPTG